MNDCIFLFVGDKLLYDNRLCEITKVSPDGVMVKDGVVSRFLFCTALKDISLEWRIEFGKGKYTGFTHTKEKIKAEKERDFLIGQGWEAKIYQVQVA